MGNTPCTTTLALGLRCNGEAHLAQVFAEGFALKRRLAQGFEEVEVVVLHRGITLGELLQLTGKVWGGLNLTVH